MTVEKGVAPSLRTAPRTAQREAVVSRRVLTLSVVSNLVGTIEFK
jgi:hypothetical protein